jgi:hypothetical protein
LDVWHLKLECLKVFWHLVDQRVNSQLGLEGLTECQTALIALKNARYLWERGKLNRVLELISIWKLLVDELRPSWLVEDYLLHLLTVELV